MTTIPNANHTYASAGNFPVTVTVRDTTNVSGTGPCADREGAVQLAAARVLHREPAVHDDEHVDHLRRHAARSTATARSRTTTGTSTTARRRTRPAPTTTHTFSSTRHVRRHARRHGRGQRDLGRRSSATSRSRRGNCPPQDVYFTYSPESLPVRIADHLHRARGRSRRLDLLLHVELGRRHVGHDLADVRRRDDEPHVRQPGPLHDPGHRARQPRPCGRAVLAAADGRRRHDARRP